MKANGKKEKYVAFLRGINVGGHHKVPMAELCKEMEKLNFENIVTLLNTGNIIFDAVTDDPVKLKKIISEHLEKVFGFPVPAVVRKAKTIRTLLDDDPFKNVVLTKDIRLYVSFLHKDVEPELKLPWTSSDDSYTIISKSDNIVLSVLDLAISKTPQAMEALERYFGRDITTRNWNTIKRIEKKLEINH